MIRPMNLKNIERKIQDFNENLTMFDQQFIIIPYQPTGYRDYSNFGQLDRPRYIQDFETYKRVWTGNDSFQIIWKDSIEYYNTDQDPKVKKRFKFGDFFTGWMEQNSSSVEIDTDVSFSEYKAQTTEKTLIFRVNANKFNLDTNYEFLFYKVPEIYGNILFRVESLEREYMGTDLMCYVLTLKSLNQELSNTGRAKQQNVMPNPPGSGYWDAQVIKEAPQNNTDFKEFYGRYIVANKIKQTNNPAKYVVIKAYGMSAISNVAFWGRRATLGGDFKEFGIPEWIFPMNFTQASTYTLYRTQSEQTNFYWIREFTPLIRFEKDSMTALKNTLAFSHVWPSQGFAQINKGVTYKPGPNPGDPDVLDNDGIAEMKKTNPIIDGSYNEQLFGKVSFKAGVKTYTPWKFTVQKTIKNGFKTDMNYGCAQYFDDSGEFAIHDVMLHTFWKQKNMKALPINSANTLDFGWTISSALSMATSGEFYSAAALIGIGIAGNLIQRLPSTKFEGFSCMVPASLMDFMINENKNIFKHNGEVKLSYFIGGEGNDIGKFFSTDTINTSFEAELTDLMQYKYGTNAADVKTVLTAMIGQTKDEQGQDILPTAKPVLLNGQEKLIPIQNDNVGFIIDAIHIQGIFQGDYSIEFLDKQKTVIWSGVYQSQGKWADSIREINTWIDTSVYGRENMFIAKPLPWPKEPAELDIIDTLPSLIYTFGEDDTGKRLTNLSPGPTTRSMKDIFEKKFNLRFVASGGGLDWYGSKSNNDIFFQKDVELDNAYMGSIKDLLDKRNKVAINFVVYGPQSNTYEVKLTAKNWLLKGDYAETDFTVYGSTNNDILVLNKYVYYVPGDEFNGDNYDAIFRFETEQRWYVFLKIFKEAGTNILKVNIKLHAGHYEHKAKVDNDPNYLNDLYKVGTGFNFNTAWNPVWTYKFRGTGKDREYSFGGYVSKIELING